MTMEEAYGNVWNKLMHDHWGNMVLLRNGDWFIASELKQVYEFGGQAWAEFAIDDEFYDERIGIKYGRQQDLKDLGLRSIAININEIVMVGEFEG